MEGSKRGTGSWTPFWRLSLFEKVILVNALMLVLETLAGLWVTSHSLESHHYVIDTAFIIGAMMLSLGITFLLMRASFRPLFNLLQTMRAISAGKTQARAANSPTDTEIGELARAFNRMLDRLEETRREQTVLILQAQEEERRRVALELHDESSQNLTALLVHAEILQQSLQALPDSALTPQAREQLRAGLQQLTQLTHGTLESIRTLALQLRPAVLDDLGLLAALRWLAEDCRERLHLSVDLQLACAPAAALPPLYETTLFRVAQESLTNVARHAHASAVTIELAGTTTQVTLRIQDNGLGMAEDMVESKMGDNTESKLEKYAAQQGSPGLGVRGMRERLELLNGTLVIQTEAGQGTTVLATLPLPGETIYL